MRAHSTQPGPILIGALFNEPMRVETVRANGPGVWDVGLVGVHSDRFRRVTLTAQDLEALTLQAAPARSRLRPSADQWQRELVATFIVDV